MNARIAALMAQKKTKVEAMRALADAAEAAGRDLNTDEATQYAALRADIDALGARLTRAEELEREERTMGAVSVIDGSSISVGAPRLLEDPRRGFRSYG